MLVSQVSVFACEPQPIVVEGLQRILEKNPEFTLCGAAPNSAESLPLVAVSQPGIILVDQSGGLRGALQFIVEAKRISPESQPILWVQEMANVESFRFLQNGVRGIVKKTLPVASLLDCLRTVARGGVWMENGNSSEAAGFANRRSAPRLTARERDIVRLVCRGMKNRQIGEELRITSGTVKVHLMHVFEKTGVKDRFELAIQGRKLVEGVAEEQAAGAGGGTLG